jgi:hypothetical protein
MAVGSAQDLRRSRVADKPRRDPSLLSLVRGREVAGGNAAAAGVRGAGCTSSGTLTFSTPPMSLGYVLRLSGIVCLCFAARLMPAQPSSAPSQQIREPAVGSALRTAILDATRTAVKTTSRFRVHHLRASDRWAYLVATEVVELDDKELQETDLSVEALLEKAKAGGPWRVVELWMLPDEDKRPHATFLERVKSRRSAAGIPDRLFPDTTGN